MVEIGETIYFKSRKEFRDWLLKNHKTKKELWLGFHKKHTNKGWLEYKDAVDEAICFGWIDCILKRIDHERHVTRFTPRKKGSVWSLINKNKARKMIDEGRMTAEGLRTIEEAKKNGEWDKAYTSKILIDVPMDLRRALSKHKKAFENFNKLSNSQKNIYVGWVIGAKTDETRNRRISEVVVRSKKNKKSEL
ncbi:MAG: YdeI/OmpD-associated family protein [Candidatus Micrarchaeota archaeon]